ncbi:hypothetical protein ES705_23395 [subsurface metagenome]
MNTDQWEKVKVSLPFKKVKVSLPKGQGRAEEKGQGILTVQRNYKENSKKGGVGLKKLSYKEKEKLEGKEWLEQDMLEKHLFSKSFIDDILLKYPFMTLYDCWLKLLDSNAVNSPEGWFISKLRNYQEEE